MYVNTASEYDGSDSGAHPDEAVSWGKIRSDSAPVKVSERKIKNLFTPFNFILFTEATTYSCTEETYDYQFAGVRRSYARFPAACRENVRKVPSQSERSETECYQLRMKSTLSSRMSSVHFLHTVPCKFILSSTSIVD